MHITAHTGLKTSGRLLFPLLLFVSLSLSACGAKSSSPDSAPAEAAPVEASSSAMSSMSDMEFQEELGLVNQMDISEAPSATPSPDTVQAVAVAERKIIRHTTLSLETKAFENTVTELLRLTEAAGGYIETQNVEGRSLEQDAYYSRTASICARIPAEKLDETVASVGGLCNITTKNESTENITDQYYDAQAHLKSLRLQEERLLAILEKAEKLEDVVTLEQALGQTRYEIERLTASLRRMDSQVTFSYLNLELREVVEYKQPQSAPATFGAKLLIAGEHSIARLVDSVQGAILVLVEIGPVLLLWVLLLGGAALLLYKGIRRRRKVAPTVEAPTVEDTEDPQ